METDNDTETGMSENDENQNGENQNSQETTLKTNFLEFGYPNKNGEHTYALVYPPGETRGEVAAKIHISYEGDSKQAVFTAKDLLGNTIYPPTTKLWELKKTIKENSVPLLKLAQLDKATLEMGKPEQKKEEPIIEKEAKAIGNKVLDEGKEFAGSAKEILTGTGRSSELKTIRKKKIHKSKGLQR